MHTRQHRDSVERVKKLLLEAGDLLQVVKIGQAGALTHGSAVSRPRNQQRSPWVCPAELLAISLRHR
jgi:hypothetical protein